MSNNNNQNAGGIVSFKTYSFLSVACAVGMIFHAFQKQEHSFFNTIVYLTSQKVNLLIFFNFFVVTLINVTNLLIWIFFDQIRTIEYKYLMDKSQKKIFHFLLLALILRSTFDLYKFLSLAVLFGFWIIHWLVYKRSDYLVSRGSRSVKEHLRLLILYGILIAVDFIIGYAFYDKFQVTGEKMNEIYVIIGFEFIRLLLKAIQDNFKYTLSLFELYHREQWTEKGFVFNIVSFAFDIIVLLLNIKLFMYIISRQQFPLYLLSEIIDTFVRLGKSIQLFIQSRSLINKLKRLPDVNAPEDLPAGVDNTCIICLEEIKQAKKLKCGHIFHLNCLRRWLEQNVQCPTCRDKIELDYTSVNGADHGPINRDLQRMREREAQAARRRAARMARRFELAQQQQQAFNAQIEEQKLQSPEKSQPQVPLVDSLEQISPLPPKLTQSLSQQPLISDQTLTTNNINLDDQLAKLREQRLQRFRSSQQQQLPLISTEENKKEENEEVQDKQPTVKFEINEQQEEEIKEMIIQEQEEDEFKDIFRVSQEELMDMFDKNLKLIEEVSRNDPFALFDIEEQHNNQPLIEDIDEDKEESSDKDISFVSSLADIRHQEQPAIHSIPTPSPFNLRFGSVPYGLPCIALTRRTIDVSLRNKQIEMINDKVTKVMRQPGEYVKAQEVQ